MSTGEIEIKHFVFKFLTTFYLNMLASGDLCRYYPTATWKLEFLKSDGCATIADRFHSVFLFCSLVIDELGFSTQENVPSGSEVYSSEGGADPLYPNAEGI